MNEKVDFCQEGLGDELEMNMTSRERNDSWYTL